MKEIKLKYLPKIIYGTAWKKERTTELVVQAVQAGFRAIDTACQPKHYAEEKVGEALLLLQKQGFRREDLYLQTKFTPLTGQDPNAIPYDKNAPLDVQVAQSFETSKKNLQTDYVDALVLHSPLFPYAKLLQVWKALEQIQKEGGALLLGISNCYDLEVLRHLYEDAEIKPAVVQNRFYADSGYDKALRLWCKNNNIIYQSFWSLTANPHILASEIVRNLAKEYNKTQAQIFFNYLNSEGIVPLSGTTSKIHMLEDLAIFDFELSLAQRKNMSELLL